MTSPTSPPNSERPARRAARASRARSCDRLAGELHSAALSFDESGFHASESPLVPVAAALVLVSSAVVFGLARSGSDEAVGRDLKETTTVAGGGAEAAPSTGPPRRWEDALTPAPA